MGKGVIIAQNLNEAKGGIHEIMEDKVFGASGNNVVVEEFLTGPEVSVLAFVDSKTIVPMVSSMDHKRALDGDQVKHRRHGHHSPQPLLYQGSCGPMYGNHFPPHSGGYE